MNEFFNVGTTSSGKPLIDIRGNIGSDWWNGDVDAETFKWELDQIGNVPEIHVHIASQGGSVMVALSIYHMLRKHSAKIVTTVYSEASSSASFIFLAGDERIMLVGTSVYVHEPLTEVRGYADDLFKTGDYLNQIKNSILDIYVERAGIDRDVMAKLMKDETLMNADEALRRGFATVVNVPDLEIVNSTDRTIFNKTVKREYEEMDKILEQIKALGDVVTALSTKVEAMNVAPVVEAVAPVVEAVAPVVEAVLTKDQVQAKATSDLIEQRESSIKAVCAAAGKSDSAQHFIEANVTVEAVMQSLVDLSGVDNDIEINTSLGANIIENQKEEISSGWKKAYKR